MNEWTNKWRSNLTLPSYIDLIPPLFRAVTLRFSSISHLSHPCYTPHPSHRPSCDHLIIFGEVYTLRSISICRFLQPSTALNSDLHIRLKRKVIMVTPNKTWKYNPVAFIFAFLERRRVNETFKIKGSISLQKLIRRLENQGFPNLEGGLRIG